MGIVWRLLKWIWRRVSDATTFSDLLGLFDQKAALWAAIGWVVAMFVAATNYDWSVQAVLFAALFGATCVAIISVVVRFWLIDKRRDTSAVPPHSPSISAELNHVPMTIDNYEVVNSIRVKNNTGEYLKEKCLVKLLEMSSRWPDTMPQDFVLRTESQIRGRRSGRFNLATGDKKTVPILFRKKERRDFLILIDENIDSHGMPDKEKCKHQIPMPKTTLEMVIETSGAEVPGRYLLTLAKGPDWALIPEIRQVFGDYVLSKNGGVLTKNEKEIIQSPAAVAPELAGVVNAMMERAGAYEFRFPLPDSDAFLQHHEMLKSSAHPIWTNVCVNQIRREFLNRCHRLGAKGEVSLNAAEFSQLQQELRTSGRYLIAKLLGETADPADPIELPLEDAARIAYEETRGGQFSKSAEGYDGTDNGIIQYYAFHILTNATLFGKRPPSTRLEQINAQTPRVFLRFVDGHIEAYRNHSTDRFRDLEILRLDLDAAIKRIKEIDTDVAANEASSN